MDFTDQNQNNCPLCQMTEGNFILNSDKFKKCKSCGTVYNLDYAPLTYNDTYFTTDYQQQYGKTYAEDFPNIYRQSSIRIKRIKKLIDNKKNLSAIDIGCALGFFLKCAADSGFSKLTGVEISEYAINYARQNYQYDFYKEPLENFIFPEKYDLISAWYVMEHFPQTAEIFSKIITAIKPGGILAFSMPSAYGPLLQHHPADWIKSHPTDHRIDVTPKSIKLFLKKQGFKKVKVYAAGFHPERSFSKKSILFPVFKIFYKMKVTLTAYSDTIEVYAVKE